jgi:DNA-binding NtrC family response regulator
MDAVQMVRRAQNRELPFSALPAISELRKYLEKLEMDIVTYARDKGATWDEIAEAMGITRQALYQRMRNRERKRTKR